MIIRIAEALRRLHREEKGFTLVELLIVLAIIGILVAIAIPVYSNVMLRAAQKTHDANLRTIDGAIQMYFMGEDKWPGTIGELVGDYLDSLPAIPEYLITAGKFAEGTTYEFNVDGAGVPTAGPVGDWGGYRATN
jgi:prepilin-type N-terminal cleavage/methylation domain-containing protein